MWRTMQQGSRVCNPTVVLRRAAVAGERFDAADGPYCDNALWLRVARHHDVGYLAAALAAYRVHGPSQTAEYQLRQMHRGYATLTPYHAVATTLANERFLERSGYDASTRRELRRLLRRHHRRSQLGLRVHRWLPRRTVRLLRRVLSRVERLEASRRAGRLMFADAGSVTEGSTLDTDVCIVGAGPAGITLATQLEDAGVRTLVLEGGGLDRERAAEEPLRGERAGYPYPPLHRARVRAFGGTSRHWPPQTAMLTRPLDPIDFEARAAVPHSGWPFDHRHLGPFYERAHDLCRLPRPDYDVGLWTEEGEAPRLPLPEALVDTAIMRMAPPDAFTQQQARLRSSRDVTVLLHATVVEICTGPTADRVDRLRVAREPGRTFGVTARCYVLASGGLDTPRLLLHSRERWRDGLGNAHGLVGRFFMEHLGARAGVLLPSDPTCSRGWACTGGTTVRSAGRACSRPPPPCSATRGWATPPSFWSRSTVRSLRPPSTRWRPWPGSPTTGPCPRTSPPTLAPRSGTLATWASWHVAGRAAARGRPPMSS